MRRMICSLAIALAAAACAPVPMVGAPAQPPAEAHLGAVAQEPSAADLAIQASDQPGAARSGTWVGAAGESEYVMAGTTETTLGVWVDVPTNHVRRAPADVAVVIDTSGSMAGPKIESARLAAKLLIEKLSDGDIVSVTTFSDAAHVVVSPIVLDGRTRAGVLEAVAGLRPGGGTAMFHGLNVAEGYAASAPATHPVRRVVMISDGIANIGPSSPETLGAMATQGARAAVQVTAIGVGLDYDERTLDALAVGSSGRLYHVDAPSEMVAIADREVGLMKSTAATGAIVEIVPAPGVVILGAEGAHIERMGSNVRVPIGAMFGGQHREMLLKLRVTADAAPGDAGRPLASVRLRFNDPTDGGVERVQEVVARYQVTRDVGRVEASANGRTRAMAAAHEAGEITMMAAQHVNEGRFDDADRKLAEAEARLRREAARAKDETDRQRVLAVASHVSHARATVKADAAAPAPAKRAHALQMNQAIMTDAGF